MLSVPRFALIRDAGGGRPYQIALSVEKEPSAFATLRLRSFFRQFAETPKAYYDYLAGYVSKDELISKHSAAWQAACEETAMLELGTAEATDWLNPVLDRIGESAADGTILIGGPPCQAYSLVGRARNRGKVGYDPASDHRHFLYEEYIRILNRLQPVAFVMENVKGMLSARVDGESMIDKIVDDLKAARGKPDSYVLVPLVADQGSGHVRHIIRSENFQIPSWPRSKPSELGFRQVCGPVPRPDVGCSLDYFDEPYLEGWTLFHPPGPVAVPEPDGSRGCSAPDLPRQLLFRGQHDPAIRAGRQRGPTSARASDRGIAPADPVPSGPREGT